MTDDEKKKREAIGNQFLRTIGQNSFADYRNRIDEAGRVGGTAASVGIALKEAPVTAVKILDDVVRPAAIRPTLDKIGTGLIDTTKVMISGNPNATSLGRQRQKLNDVAMQNSGLTAPTAMTLKDVTNPNTAITTPKTNLNNSSMAGQPTVRPRSEAPRPFRGSVLLTNVGNGVSPAGEAFGDVGALRRALQAKEQTQPIETPVQRPVTLREVGRPRRSNITIKGAAPIYNEMQVDMKMPKFTAPGFSGDAKAARIHSQEQQWLERQQAMQHDYNLSKLGYGQAIDTQNVESLNTLQRIGLEDTLTTDKQIQDNYDTQQLARINKAKELRSEQLKNQLEIEKAKLPEPRKKLSQNEAALRLEQLNKEYLDDDMAFDEEGNRINKDEWLKQRGLVDYYKTL